VDRDPRSHGTRMAMLIGARAAPPGLIGIAPETRILPVAVGVGDRIPDAGGFVSARAIRWAVDHGAAVINMSYAGPHDLGCPSPLIDAIWYALDRGVVLVAAAGNEGRDINQPETPALCPGIVAVGAVDDQGRPWVDTERQGYVDLAAP